VAFLYWYLQNCLFRARKTFKVIFSKDKSIHKARMGDKVWLLLDYPNPVLNNIAQKERGVLSKNKRTSNLKV